MSCRWFCPNKLLRGFWWGTKQELVLNLWQAIFAPPLCWGTSRPPHAKPPGAARDGRHTHHHYSLLSTFLIFFLNLQPKCTVNSLLWNTFELRQIQGFTVGKFLFFKIIFISQPEMERDLCQKHCHVLACRCQSKSEFTTCTSWETSMVYGEYIAHKHRPYCM